MRDQELAGKVAIVTGAGMGIGGAAAHALAGAGASVVVADIDRDAGQATVDAITKARGQALFVATDVCRMQDMENLAAATVERFGGIDILVNNAAKSFRGTVDAIDEASWNEVIATNLTSVWRGMRVCVPLMRRRGGGSVINLSLGAIARRLRQSRRLCGIQGRCQRVDLSERR